MEPLADMLRGAPSSDAGRRLAEWLRALERTGHGWDRLFDALLPCCEHVGREFADVASADEARGACMTLAYERSVGAWLDGVARGTQGRPFATFVADQLRDHLRAMRRTRVRRASLDREVALTQGGSHPGAEALSRADPPDGHTHLRELVERIEAHPGLDDRARRVLCGLASGLDQREIARIEGLSEPTVSRAVTRLRGALSHLVHAEDRTR